MVIIINLLGCKRKDELMNTKATRFKKTTGMKSTLVVKILLDISMLALYIFLVYGLDASPLFHEVAGIGIGVMYGLHLFLNRKWIANVFKGKIKGTKNVLNVIFDSLLFIGMILIIVTGILISNILFVNNLPIEYGLIVDIHDIASYICLGVMGLHVLMHLKYLFLSIKNILKNIGKPAVVRVYASFAVCVVIVSIIYLQFSAFEGYKYDTLNAAEPTTSPIVAVSPTPTITPTVSPTTTPTSDPIIEATPEPVPPASLDMLAEAREASESSVIEEEATPTPESSQEEIVQPEEPETAEPPMTLNDFLAGMTCTACSKRCSLLSPRCGRGEDQAYSATLQYNEEYGIS